MVPLGTSSNCCGGDIHVVALSVNLVGFGAQHFVEFLQRDLHEARMRDPGAVVAVGGFAVLVFAHFWQCGFVRGGIGLDGDKRGHAAHGERAALWQTLMQARRIGAHEGRRSW